VFAGFRVGRLKHSRALDAVKTRFFQMFLF
jgi:hypothetical protein